MELEELLANLNRNKISYSGWFRSVNDLLKEINTGESSIDDKGVNHLAVVNCEITDARGYRLLESEQLYNDGRRINRLIKVSGKLQRNESPTEAMVRELSEELSLPSGDYRLVYTGSTVRENNNRPFYATLPSRCVRHHFELQMPEELWREEYVEIAPDKVAWFHWFQPE